MRNFTAIGAHALLTSYNDQAIYDFKLIGRIYYQYQMFIGKFRGGLGDEDVICRHGNGCGNVQWSAFPILRELCRSAPPFFCCISFATLL
jgi:hypothetical protein